VGAGAVVVLLGDQPLVSSAAVDRVVAAHHGDPATDALRARYGDVPGHPVLLTRALFDAVEHLGGDAGARDLLRGAGVRAVDCDGLGDPIDVDTPGDLATLEAAIDQGRP
jgi:CTP:molybdopterin cytidylyltransferase MocA